VELINHLSSITRFRICIFYTYNKLNKITQSNTKNHHNHNQKPISINHRIKPIEKSKQSTSIKSCSCSALFRQISRKLTVLTFVSFKHVTHSSQFFYSFCSIQNQQKKNYKLERSDLESETETLIGSL